MGIDIYKDENIKNLKAAKQDIKQIEKALNKKFKKSGSHKKFNHKIYLLEDEKAILQNFKNQISELSNKGSKRDLFIFYFAGHGTDEGILLHDLHLKFEDLRDLLEKEFHHVLLILDCCFGVDIFKNKKFSSPYRYNLAENFMKKAFWAITSTNSNQKFAIERNSKTRGEFSMAFESVIKGNREEILSPIKIMEDIKKILHKKTNLIPTCGSFGSFEEMGVPYLVFDLDIAIDAKEHLIAKSVLQREYISKLNSPFLEINFQAKYSNLNKLAHKSKYQNFSTSSLEILASIPSDFPVFIGGPMGIGKVFIFFFHF
jgi:hypothetical protein